MNVFEKYLKQQVGEEKYEKYMEDCKRNLTQNDMKEFNKRSEPIYEDMYEHIKEDSEETIVRRIEGMIYAIQASKRITRNFALVFLTYLLANIVLLGLELDYGVTCASILLMGGCFIYKLVEFVGNKYCVLDAYLLMIYRAVLQKLEKEKLRNQTLG